MPAKKKPEPLSPAEASAAPPPTPGVWPAKHFIHSFAFLPGTHRMLTGHALSNEILEWDLDSGDVVKTWRKGRKNKDGVNAIAVRADGKQFIAVDQSGMAGSTNFTRVWELGKEQPVVELLGHRGPVVTAAFLPGGRAVTGGRDDTLRVWDLDDGGTQLHEMKHGEQVVALAVSADGKTAVTGGWDTLTSLTRWDLERGDPLGDLGDFAKPPRAIALSSDGKLACVTSSGELHVLDYESGASLVAVPNAHTGSAGSVAWSADASVLVTTSEFDETVRLFRADGTQLQTISLPRPNEAAFGPDGIVYVALAYQGIARFKRTASTLEQLVPG